MAFKIMSLFLAIVIAHISSATPLELQHSPNSGDNRIVGGVNAEEGYAPHMVALVFESSVLILTCGGSLVSRRHVLTAAHCILPFVWGDELLHSFGAVVGSNQWNTRENLIHFSSHKIHPKYDGGIIKNDIGMLTLNKKVKLSDKVAVISLNYEWIGGGVECSATGFGGLWTWGPIPDDLQVLHLSTITPQQCIEKVEAASDQWGAAPPVDPEVEICTFHSDNHGMCNGDSGSALVELGSGLLVAIVSWGFPCARGLPDMYVRVSAFRDFIEPILNEDF